MTANTLVFDVARGSQVDGPGLRTTVFLKGCPLRCIWCHNPESQRYRAELSFEAGLCNHCGNCRKACPQGAIASGRSPVVNPLLCNGCGQCVEVCDQGSLVMLGRQMDSLELLELLMRDRVWYQVSGGGVTFSGGEPLSHISWLTPICSILANGGISVMFQTCGYFSYSEFCDQLLPFTDQLYFDLKLIDEEEHRHLTGRSNRKILNNFRKLNQQRPGLIRPRIPLIPGFTATARNLDGLGIFLAENGFTSCELVPYHGRSPHKWKLLGRTPPGELKEEPLRPEELAYWRSILARRLPAMAGR